MKKKPASLNIIAFGYLLAPLINIWRTAWMNNWPYTGPRSVFNHFSETEWALLALFPIVAFGVFRVSKWGYFLFIAFSLVLIAHNTYAFYESSTYSLYLVLLFHVVTLGVVGFFLQKHIVTAYFNPKVKWWERDPRFHVNLNVKIVSGKRTLKASVLDFSKGGCFIDHGGRLKLGNTIQLSFKLDTIHFETTAEVMRISHSKPRGVGLMFVNLKTRQKRTIRRILKNLVKAREKHPTPHLRAKAS